MIRLSDIARKMRGGQLIALSFVVAAMVGCSNEVSVDQNFVDTFVELRIVEVTYGPNSPMTRMTHRKVLEQHGYTLEKFLAKTDKILEDENMWVPFQKTVSARVDSLVADMNKAKVIPSPSVPHSPKGDD